MFKAIPSFGVTSEECNPIVYIHYQRKSESLSNIIIVVAAEVDPLVGLRLSRLKDLRVLQQWLHQLSGLTDPAVD